MTDGPFNRAIEREGDLLDMTAQIVTAHVSHNTVALSDIATLISNTHAALSALGKPVEPIVEKPIGAVSVRASLKPDALISMIDGRPYKMLRRHIGQHGYTPDSYRKTFGLPDSYPMVAPNYTEQRRQLAIKIGLGTKRRRA
jgi:predicted transcriptional regulator